MRIDRERLVRAMLDGYVPMPSEMRRKAIIDAILTDIEAQGFVVVPKEPIEAAVEAACRAHCDYFGGNGWWDTGLIADTKPKAAEAMRSAWAAMLDAAKDAG